MVTRTRARIVGVAAAAALALLATGCADRGADPQQTPSSPPPSASAASAAPSPSSSGPAQEFQYPDKTDPTQVAIYLKYEGSDPSGEMIAGPAVLVADRTFSVEAQCEGDDLSFEVVTADGEKRILVDGEIDCDEPPSGGFSYQLPYAGPVQVNIADADDVGRAWVRVIQP